MRGVCVCVCGVYLFNPSLAVVAYVEQSRSATVDNRMKFWTIHNTIMSNSLGGNDSGFVGYTAEGSTPWCEISNARLTSVLGRACGYSLDDGAPGIVGLYYLNACRLELLVEILFQVSAGPKTTHQKNSLDVLVGSL